MKKCKCLAFTLISTLIFSIITFHCAQRVSATPDGFRIKLPFRTSWEDEPTESFGRNSSVDYKKDFSSQYLDDVDNKIQPPSPEIFGYTFGDRQLRADGSFDSSYSYCYFNLFDMTPESDARPPFKIRQHTFIGIFYYHDLRRDCMIDAQLYNKRTHQYSTLRDFVVTYQIDSIVVNKYIVDQNGVRIHPAYRYDDPIGSWQFASFDLSIIYESDPENWYVTKIWIGFDNGISQTTGPARTYFDKLYISYAVGDKKTVTFETGGGYYNVWLSAAIEAWDYFYHSGTDKYDLWLKVAVSGFSDGYAKDQYGYPTYYRYPYKLRVSTNACAEALKYPQPTGVNLTQVDENVGLGKVTMFLFDLAAVFVGYYYAPAGYLLAALALAEEFAGLSKKPEVKPTYEWPKGVRWEDFNQYLPYTEPPSNVIQGEVYLYVYNLSEGWNSIPLTFEVDTCLAFYSDGVWYPGGLSTESFTLNIDWTTEPDYVNFPPNTPLTPSGPTSGYMYTTCTYSTSTTDPNGDDVRYEFNWGDDSPSTRTGWYGSGENATASHYWTSPGTYQVKVSAQDETYTWSDWSQILTVTITATPQPPPVEENRYWVMANITTSCGYLNGTLGWKWNGTCPFATRPPNLTPLLMSRNITFSEPNPMNGVVYLTVPASSYVGLDHISYDKTTKLCCRFRLTMIEDGFGWLFTGTGSNPILGDVDCYTFSNNTGVYWLSPSPKASQLAALPGGFPSVGSDCIAGTNDDGFGDGHQNPPGSSILYLPTKLDVDYWDVSRTTWRNFYEAPWPQALTTGTAYNIIIEPSSKINGASSTQTGQPWEFLAGLDHPEYAPVPWNHNYSNAYVTYACVWSMLRINPGVWGLDTLYTVVEKLVREDCVIADINGDEVVDIEDVVICSMAFGSKDEGWGRQVADPKFDARADLADPRGEIDMGDVVTIAVDFGAKLTPKGIKGRRY